jgi:hypothetical protein
MQLQQSLQLLLHLGQREQLLVHVLHLTLQLVGNCCQLVTGSCHSIQRLPVDMVTVDQGS